MNPGIEEGLDPITFLIDTVAKEFGVSATDLRLRSRVAEVVEARQVVMHVGYIGWHSHTLARIGLALDGRTPATVSWGYQVIARRLTASEPLRLKVERVRDLLKEGG